MSTQASNYISFYFADISAASGGVIELDCSVVGTGLMQVIGVSALTVQKYISGSRQTMDTWSSLYQYGSTQASVGLTYQGTAGSQYRAIITFYAADAYGSDSKVMTTNSVTAIN